MFLHDQPWREDGHYLPTKRDARLDLAQIVLTRRADGDPMLNHFILFAQVLVFFFKSHICTLLGFTAFGKSPASLGSYKNNRLQEFKLPELV